MRFFVDHPLAKKITIVTVIKLLGLLVIWWFFFSGPSVHSLTPDQVSNAILHPLTHHTTTP
ncbi:MAG: cytochrome oxidase putative small subunit CydP [Gallionellaceae bacterium]